MINRIGLIEDLKLVNETSRKLNSNMAFDEMIEFLKLQLFNAFKPTQIAFVFNNEEESYDVSQMSTDYFHTSVGKEYISFVSTHFKKEEESLFDANFSSTVDKPTDYESVIAIPITNQENVVGFVICMHERSVFLFIR